MGHVVGFLGDGVNDAPAMHAADTSLSVDHAVDVAREAARRIASSSGLFNPVSSAASVNTSEDDSPAGV